MNPHRRLTVLDAELRIVLSSLGLPEERCGRARGSQLADSERDLDRWILRRFACGAQPSSVDVEAAARSADLDARSALRRMVELDLMQLDDDGVIDCAYRFSAHATTHAVILDDTTALHAMCAVDALGIPVMLHRGGVIKTRDPGSGAPIQIHVDASGGAAAEPHGAVVLCAIATGAGSLSSLCCPLVNTFEVRTTAEQFLLGRPELTSTVLSLPDAAACGATVFGGVLD